jgi:Uma2 family endonuclease
MTLLRTDQPMTVDAFLAFTDTRPDEERWELIDGEPVLNPSPAWDHQRVLGNLFKLLLRLEEQNSPWEVLLGIGVKLSNTRLPVPDLMIRPARAIQGSVCDDIIVAFEVLSPSSRSRDLRWKRSAYADLPSLQHYVVLAPKAVDIRCFDRETNWAERRLVFADADLALPAVDATVPVLELYRGLETAGG